MAFEISTIFSAAECSSLFVALGATLFCFLLATVLTIRKEELGRSVLGNFESNDCALLGEESEVGSGEEMSARLSGGGGREMAVERRLGASMMEQLMPEITTHALSYLDYTSLCRLSMTNSLMRKAANDDNAWKALYHKDFTSEQDNVTPSSGWKGYYADTRAVVTINDEFFRTVREKLLPAMGQLWLNADYVKCVHATGEAFSSYNAVMESWQLAFTWEDVVGFPIFQIQDVRVRVVTDMAWVTVKAYIDIHSEPLSMTNIYEYHNGRWYMVHHQSSTWLIQHRGEQRQRLQLADAVLRWI